MIDFSKIIMTSLQESAKLGLETLSTFSRTRHELQTAMLKHFHGAIPEESLTFPLLNKENIKLIEIALEKQYKLEQEVVTRLHNITNPSSDNEIPDAGADLSDETLIPPTPTAFRSALPDGQFLHLSVNAQKGQIKLPVTLSNHMATEQVITVEIVSEKTADAIAFPNGTIGLQPDHLVLDGKSSGKVFVVIDMDDNLKPVKTMVQTSSFTVSIPEYFLSN